MKLFLTHSGLSFVEAVTKVSEFIVSHQPQAVSWQAVF